MTCDCKRDAHKQRWRGHATCVPCRESETKRAGPRCMEHRGTMHKHQPKSEARRARHLQKQRRMPTVRRPGARLIISIITIMILLLLFNRVGKNINQVALWPNG